MKLLLDTHFLLWAAAWPGEAATPDEAVALIRDEANLLHFSAVSVWEVAIKNAKGRPHFQIDPHVFRSRLLDSGYVELAVTSVHAAGVALLPPIHKDPFDRLLVSQAVSEGLTLLTMDTMLARYPGPIRRV